ncbi:MAG: carbon-nitrogen hydrolase family protein [Gemmatimonadetes bacterium]|nr:carbon-nitrogen hydrolase family protein [Gemmatimonadota bacterium]NNM04738.1 carbon-nitrogen hydrolase family protein [Gemmatimonadota bacterium]
MAKASPFTVAVVQARPEFLDLDATVDKACELIREVGEKGAELVLFPEAFLPGYPVWVWFIPPVHTHPLREFYSELHGNSVSIPGEETDRMGKVAAEYGITVAMGVNERNSEASGSSLYNTLLYIGPDGSVLGRHRKMIPTAAERLVYAQGDGADLEVYPMRFGKLGGLICWENYMPLARYALSAWGEQIHLAPTWDRGEPWLSTMRHAAKESRTFVLGACQAFHKDDIPDRFSFKEEYLGSVDGWLNPGHSVIVNPDGKVIAGPADQEETILYSEVRPNELVGPRWQLDVAGHYGRPDVFELTVHRRHTPFLKMEEGCPENEEVTGDPGETATEV